MRAGELLAREQDKSRGNLPAPTLTERLLDDGSDWFNLACSRIMLAMLAGIVAIVIVAEIVR